ncbi:uncharacterized protein HKW66_Vig0243850 [Vigna angularis]|uniref:LisH domain-containing protein n=1 Tax=Phaseolus angularis TaxID=3914 RepID=A0A8T0L0V4_PHAAN|nr:uncharacterized protein HKW66_Vig0243850 [Vigna angularis]
MAGKQSKVRKPEVFGKGKVTPNQIAFIVDRYLCDNNFSITRSSFRTEASSLIANSPIHEAPKSLLTLGEMLDEYICLKEQKVMLDQERIVVEQEKKRVQMLLQGMQNVMTAYNASGNLSAAAPAAKSTVAAITQPTYTLKSQPGQTALQQSGNAVNRMVAQPSAVQSSTMNCIPRESQVQGSNVAKCLFNQSTTSVPSNSPVPKTPPRTKSSHGDTHISPAEISSVAVTPRMDFSFTEMLNDLDFSCEGIDFSSHPTPSPSMDNASGSSHECNDNHATPEFSTVAEVLCEKDMKILGPDCLSAMKSVTKSITVISPVQLSCKRGKGKTSYAGI